MKRREIPSSLPSSRTTLFRRRRRGCRSTGGSTGVRARALSRVLFLSLAFCLPPVVHCFSVSVCLPPPAPPCHPPFPLRGLTGSRLATRKCNVTVRSLDYKSNSVHSMHSAHSRRTSATMHDDIAMQRRR